MAKKALYKMIDLFAGCGGLSLGMEQSGFTPWFVNEIIEQFANTYKYNHNLPDEHYYIGDIAELNETIHRYDNLFFINNFPIDTRNTISLHILFFLIVFSHSL